MNRFKMLKNLLFTVLVAALIVSCGKTNSKESSHRAGAAIDALPSWAMGPFIRPAGDVNPIITPQNTSYVEALNGDSLGWESGDTFNPAATVMDGSIYILYRAEDQSGQGIGQRTSRIGLARSDDGIHIRERFKQPVLYPRNDDQKQYEWPGGTEDPRVAKTEDGRYIMLYTQWNREVPRLAVATSTNLKDWDKHGPAFEDAYDGKFKDRATKSGSVVTKLVDGEKVITKVNGQYFMYWGEKKVYAATSSNLLDWKPIVDDQENLKPLAAPREGFFDSELTEAGPPALMTDKGILLLYNGKNSATKGDTSYTANTYAAGQILFDKEEPTKVLERLDEAFLVPTEPFEKSGQYPDGTVFIEGLVHKEGTWYLYYGCADSRVAVAVYNPDKHTNL